MNMKGGAAKKKGKGKATTDTKAGKKGGKKGGKKK